MAMTKVVFETTTMIHLKLYFSFLIFNPTLPEIPSFNVV